MMLDDAINSKTEATEEMPRGTGLGISPVLPLLQFS